MIKHLFLISILSFLSIFIACSKESTQHVQTQNSIKEKNQLTKINSSREKKKFSLIEQAEKDAIILTVNDIEIKKKEFENLLLKKANESGVLDIKNYKDKRQYKRELLEITRPYLEKMVLQLLIHQKALILNSKKEKVNVSEKEIDASFDGQIKKIKKLYKNNPKAVQIITNNIDKSRKDVTQRDIEKGKIILSKMRFIALKNVKDITKKDLDALYEAKKSIFQDEYFVQLKQFTIKKNGGSLNQMKEFRKNLVILKGDDLTKKFHQISIKNSQDSYRKLGGEVGYISTRKLIPALAESAEKIKLNTISDIIESEAGFHLIYLSAREKKQVKKDELLIRLTKLWKRDRQDQALKQQLDDALKDIKVTVKIKPMVPPSSQIPAFDISKVKETVEKSQNQRPEHQLPLPSKDNVLPGVNNPHDLSQQPLKLKSKPQNEGNPLKLKH